MVALLKLGVVLKDVYASFEGQIQQVLFNGEQWGLWNIRSASDAVLHGEFQRYRSILCDCKSLLLFVTEFDLYST